MKLNDFKIEIKNFEQYKRALKVIKDIPQPSKLKRFWSVVKFHLMIANFYVSRFFIVVKSKIRYRFYKLKKRDHSKNPIVRYFKIDKEELIDNQIYRYKLFIQGLTNKLRYDLEDLEFAEKSEEEKPWKRYWVKGGDREESRKKYSKKSKRLFNIQNVAKDKLPKIRFNEKLMVGFIILRTPTKIFYILITLFSLFKTLKHNFISDTIVSHVIYHTIILFTIYCWFFLQLKRRMKDENWQVFVNYDYKENFIELGEDFKYAKEGRLYWSTGEENSESEDNKINDETNGEKNNNINFSNDEFLKALYEWNKKYFPENTLKNTENDSTNEYITKFSFEVPLELEMEEVRRKIPSFQRYCGKEILLTKEDITSSKFTLYLQRKELEKILKLNENKIVKNSDTKVYVGEAFDGSVYLDFDVFPHMLIGGSSGCGKGVVQNVILLQLTQKGEVVIIDLSTKAGADYSYYRGKGYRIVTELEETLDFFKGLQDEAKRRMEVFKAKGVNKISAYNKKVSEEEKMYRKFILIDEYASLKRVDKEDEEEAKEIEKTIIALGEQARAVGIHIIIATQNAKSTIINTELRNNLMLRVVGSCADGNASNIFLENDFASIKRIPPLIKAEDKGRFIVSGAKTEDRLDFDGHFVIQVPFVEFAGDMAGEHIGEYGHLVEPPKVSKILQSEVNLKKDEIKITEELNEVNEGFDVRELF